MVDNEEKMQEITDTPEEDVKAENTEKTKTEDGKKVTRKAYDELKKETDSLTNQLEEMNDKYLRMMAEYENFRKRSTKERDGLYTDAYCDAVREILPLIDNLERASQFLKDDDDLSEGVRLTINQLDAIFDKMGIEVISPEGEKFNPEIHNAVMHSEDDGYEEITVVQVFSKGYKKGDKIIRYAMVQVVN